MIDKQGIYRPHHSLWPMLWMVQTMMSSIQQLEVSDPIDSQTVVCMGKYTTLHARHQHGKVFPISKGSKRDIPHLGLLPASSLQSHPATLLISPVVETGDKKENV